LLELAIELKGKGFVQVISAQ